MDTKKLNKKEGTSEEALISLRRGNKVVIRGRWGEGTGRKRGWWRGSGSGVGKHRRDG